MVKLNKRHIHKKDDNDINLRETFVYYNIVYYGELIYLEVNLIPGLRRGVLWWCDDTSLYITESSGPPALREKKTGNSKIP